MGRIYFTCSFDDGDIADLRLAYLLNKYNVKGTFYVPRSCDLVFKSLTDNQVKELSDLVDIGGHTISHQILTYVSNERARVEINDCKAWLEDVTSKSIKAFCPPTGRFNQFHIALQEEAGFETMRTVEMLKYSLDSIKTKNNFTILPTTVQVYNHTSTAYIKNSMKRLNIFGYSLFRNLFNQNWKMMTENYISYLTQKVEKNDAIYFFHLWGHSWEIERYSLWNSLENFLKNISGMQGITFCDNSELADIIRKEKNER